MRRPGSPPVTALIALLALAATGRAQLLQVDGAVHGVRSEPLRGAGQSLQREIAPGPLQLRFPAGGGGRPAGLDLAVPRGAFVAVAVESAPAPGQQPALLAAVLDEGVRYGAEQAQDVRVRAAVRVGADSAPFGLVCRWQGEQDHYRFVWDVRAQQLRLERVLGGQLLVLASATAPAPADRAYDLELQAEGFRLQAFCDDEPVAQVMDGALVEGRYGTWLEPGATPAFEDLLAAPPAAPLATTAAVSVGGETRVIARAPGMVGSIAAVCLRLDVPEPVWPTDAQGFEPWLLLRWGEPLVLLPVPFGEVSAAGHLEAKFRWPAAPLLAGQAALCGALLGTPDRQALAGRLPWAAVRF